ncbi:unnamed protein product [Phaeothamnion confervicola]
MSLASGRRRKARGRLAFWRLPLLISFLLLCHGVLTKKPESPPPATRVVIITAGRTGSTLLGSLFNQDPTVLSIYEPCRKRHSGRKNLYDAACGELVEKLTSCQPDADTIVDILADHSAMVFSAGLTKMAASRVGAIGGALLEATRRSSGGGGDGGSDDLHGLQSAASPAFDDVAMQRAALEAAFTDACSKYSAVVAKVIRIHEVPATLGASGIKVIELLRNPKAVVLSYLHTDGFGLGKPPAAIARNICQQMGKAYRHLRATVNAERFCSVKFEDIGLEPDESMSALYRCLGLGLPPRQTHEWIAENMHTNGADAKQSGRFTKHRNSTHIVLHWSDRWADLTPQTKAAIDAECGEALDTIGYSEGWRRE